jgi:ribosomal protein L37AE/L43A
VSRKNSLGLVEFLKRQTLSQSSAANEKLECPECGSDLIQPITNGKRCGQCGCQFALDANPVSSRARIAREDARGWPKRSDLSSR